MAHHGMRVSAALVHANALLLAEGARRLKISKVAPPIRGLVFLKFLSLSLKAAT